MAELFPRLRYADAREAYVLESEHAMAQRSYEEIATAALHHADRTVALGLQRGERVGVWADASASLPSVLIGNALAGLISVPLNPKLGARELEHVLADAGVHHVFACTIDAQSRDAHGCELHGAVEFRDRNGPTESNKFSLGIDDTPMLLLYTSGTTGAPKGALITRKNVATNVDALAAAWLWSESDTVVHALPMFHVHGLVLGLFGSLRVGGTLRHVSSFDPLLVGEALSDARHASTVMFGVPTMYSRLAVAEVNDERVRAGLLAARLLVTGSAGLQVRVHTQVQALTRRGVHERYGLTETLINCAVPAWSSPRPGYVGPALPGVELRLVDDERRTIDACDDATLGEVVVRSASVFDGYWHNNEATNAVLDNSGWFFTGDIATRTHDGSIRIVGRRSVDLIKTGGYKVGAGEVEAALLEHPGVAEVAVVGVHDDDLGERIEAFVVRAPHVTIEAHELIQLVADQLTPHKRPRAVHFVGALPRNAMGKVQKKQLVVER